MHPPPREFYARAQMEVRVITVDDQDLFRNVAREVVDATPGMRTSSRTCLLYTSDAADEL